MQKTQQIGTVNWTDEEIRASIPEFLELYKRKPIIDNQGGMKSPHMFATWFMLKQIKPKNVIESGVWKGQGTWLIENTLPEANIFSIDPSLELRDYKSEKVKYFNKDFFKIDWSIIDDKESTVLFFDDHQNALERIKKGADLGFKQFIFEDNYPAKQGDCYSLKKAFQNSGFLPDSGKNNILKRIFYQIDGRIIKPNFQDSAYLKDVLDIYYEFPPIFKTKKTRWGDDWNEENCPTPKPLFDNVEQEFLRLFEDEVLFYTWICFAKIK